MARANVPTQGLLNRWQQVMHVDPFTFNQISGKGARLEPGTQNHVFLQYERDYIATAIYTALHQAQTYLGYAPAPVWVENDIITVDTERAWNSQTLVTRYGHLQAFGRRATTLIQSAATVVFSDENGDQVDETATITITDASIATMAADEIQVFFRVADGAPSGAHECWQIEPLTVSISGSTATITGHRALFAHPHLVWEREFTDDTSATRFSGDTNNANHFVAQVDVYRVYANAMSAVELLLNAAVVGTTANVVNATGSISDAYQGEFFAYTDSSQSSPGATPDKVRASYKAGLPLVGGYMDAMLETAILRYANTLMPQMPDMNDRATAMWKDDNKQAANASAYDAWHPPAFGITTAGMKLMGVVEIRQNKLKGRPLRAA